jgi:hypothetical protein
MKKFFVCFLLIFSLTQACKAQNTLLEILEVVAEGIGAYNNAYNASRPMLKDLGSVVLDVNSASNQFWYGGHTRNYCEVPLPEGTIRWFYRATVMSIESNYNYQSNETLFYLLQNQKRVDLIFPSSLGVNLLFFTHSGELNSFYQGSSSYSWNGKLNKTNTLTTVGSVDFYQPKFWIGVQNKNQFDGLKVLIEIVAMGYFN